jgi:hypothetical protein
VTGEQTVSLRLQRRRAGYYTWTGPSGAVYEIFRNRTARPPEWLVRTPNGLTAPSRLLAEARSGWWIWPLSDVMPIEDVLPAPVDRLDQAFGDDIVEGLSRRMNLAAEESIVVRAMVRARPSLTFGEVVIAARTAIS